MKIQLTSLLFLLFTVLQTNAQIATVKRKCYDKAASRAGQQNVDYECGKLAGVVDCNEKLVYDEDTKLIYGGRNGKPFTGQCESCHTNGLIEHRIAFVNGKEHGTDTTYYRSGCLQALRTLVNGVENGQWFYYYDSTTIVAWEMNYSEGKKHGKQIFYAKNGDTTRLEFFKHGIIDGTKTTYSTNSKVEKEVHYKNGLMDGTFKVYNPEGKIVESINYKLGKKEGEFKYYYEDGRLLATEHWKDGLKNGEFKSLYYGGTIQSTGFFKEGIPEGWQEEFFNNQKIKHRVLYKKGVIIEEHKFNEQGVETYTFGAEATKAKEDDFIPIAGAKVKEDKKSRRKEKKKTSDKKSTE
jgi:antitoxin component YwqK of YwqJK toxin-antitoxin module